MGLNEQLTGFFAAQNAFFFSNLPLTTSLCIPSGLKYSQKPGVWPWWRQQYIHTHTHTRGLFPLTGRDHDLFVQNRLIGEAMSHFHTFILILFSFCPHFQRWKCYFYCTFWYLFWIMYCMVVFYMSTGFATWGSGAARAFEIKQFWVHFSQCFPMLVLLPAA